jgi:hypothetical protein
VHDAFVQGYDDLELVRGEVRNGHPDPRTTRIGPPTLLLPAFSLKADRDSAVRAGRSVRDSVEWLDDNTVPWGSTRCRPVSRTNS